jgi:hypothetical protein
LVNGCIDCSYVAGDLALLYDMTLNFGNRKANPLLALLVGLNTIPMALYTLSKAGIDLAPFFYIALLILALKGPIFSWSEVSGYIAWRRCRRRYASAGYFYRHGARRDGRQ